MFLGKWLPVGSSNRTLSMSKTGANYLALNQFSSVSVRFDSTPNQPFNVNQNPGRYFLQVCGKPNDRE